MSVDGQGSEGRRNITENFNRLSRVHERYRQTDDRQTAYSERVNVEFTFVKKWWTGLNDIFYTSCDVFMQGIAFWGSR